MGVKLLNQEEADRLAVAYLETGSKTAAYRQFYPRAHKLKLRSVTNNTSQMFGQSLVKNALVDKSNDIVSDIMAKLKHNLDESMSKHQAIYDAAFEVKEFGAAESALKSMDKLMKLDQVVEQKGHRTIRDYGSTQLATTPKVAKIK